MVGLNLNPDSLTVVNHPLEHHYYQAQVLKAKTKKHFATQSHPILITGAFPPPADIYFKNRGSVAFEIKQSLFFILSIMLI